jgi:hypothetical protein
MTKSPKLFMVLLGCTPEGRLTEQHDVFFGIGENLTELIPQMNLFWPEAKGKLHIDAWREVTVVGNYSIELISNVENTSSDENLFFLNLGGYKTDEFEEYHYKMLTVSPTLASAIKESKKTAFYKHCGFKGAVSHIDDKYGIDVDDFHKVADLLNVETKSKFQLKICSLLESKEEDELHIGYVKIKSLI